MRLSTLVGLIGVGVVPLFAGCNTDPDEDGLTKQEEKELGTDPKSADSDGDGLSDGEEVELGLNPLLEDSDGDGQDDEEELEAGTDPTNPFSWDPAAGGWPDFSADAEGVTGEGWNIGDIAENFTFVDQYGREVELYQFHGYVILIDFSAGWCAPCRDVAEGAQAMWEAHRDDGFLMVHLMIDDNSNDGRITNTSFIGSWIDDYGLEFPVSAYAEDPEALVGLDASGVFEGGIPFMVLIDQDLRIDQAFTGSGIESQIESRVEELLEAN